FLCIKGRYAGDFTDHPDRLLSPLVKVNGRFEEVSWAKALETVAARFNEVRARGGKFGVIGSNRTTNEENFYLQKLARTGLWTNNIDHHRTGDIVTLLDSLAGRPEALAAIGDLYGAKAIAIVAADLSQQHPLLAFQIRANWRHHQANVYTVTRGPVRETKIAKRAVTAALGNEVAALEALRADLAAEPELVIVFGDAVKGGAVRQLVAFGDSLGIPVKYICLMDYANSRGAADMGLVPDLGPGYVPVARPGLSLREMLDAPDLDALWVIGANPLERAKLAARNAFIVVQDLFLTATAQAADVVLPAASAYEKSGTVTNVAGEVQRLVRAIEKVGAKTDLEIFGLIAREMGLDLAQLGRWTPETVFQEIVSVVSGYDVPSAVLAAGGAARTMPLNGPRTGMTSRPETIESAGDTLFTSGTLGRYSTALVTVTEGPGELYRG
ncbi:MAG: molybdopterin-dependent oxidoreductase, partial [Bryobacteraceae bacterium]